uniref:Uncharacterized protein n=1 Tax=Tanacetum cinerariifolium TaxID=118510 RepID=A0A6L2JJ11_TANCI|nr:hypothetical protein [Tanacetum cinerariifolium]
MRIEQYIQMMDYALWEVIENGATLPMIQVLKDVTTVMPITSVEDKSQKRLKVKKLVNHLELLGEKLSQEDVNQKLLRSLSSEWNTHVVVWRNKADLDTMSMDDLYNNLKDLEQIHSDDMEEIDLRWQMAMLTMRARSEVLQLPQEGTLCEGVQSSKKSRQQVKGKHKKECTCGNTASTALVSCDGLGEYDWSDQAEEGPNYALMAYTSSSSKSKVSNDSTCSKYCLESVKLLKSHNEQLLKDLKKSELMVLGYNIGLKSVEERLKFFKKYEFIYLEDIKALKAKIQMKDIAIKELRRKLDVVQKEKDGIQLTVGKLENASNGLNKLIECQIFDNCKKRLGYENYNAVPPPYIRNFMPSKPDLSFTGLDEFANKTIVETKSCEEETKAARNNTDALIIEEWVLDEKENNVTQPKIVKKIVRPSIVKKEFVKPRQQEKTARKTVKKVEHNRQNTHRPRGNQRSWNNMMSQKLGSNLEMFNKDCYTHPYAKKNIVPRVVLMKSGLVSVNTARQVNTAQPKTTVNAARPMSYLSKTVHSTVKRPIHKNTTFKNSNVNQRVNTVRSNNVNTARPKVVVNVVKGNLVNAVKASACWVWKPKTKVIDHVYKHNSASITIKKFDYIDAQGRSKTPTLCFMRPFGCPVTILNTKDHLGKCDGKADEGFFVGYSLNCKAFRVFNSRTRIVEENLHIRFSKSTPNVVGSGPDWLFDIDALTRILNYKLIVAGRQSNGFSSTKASNNAGQARKEIKPVKIYILLPLWTADLPFSQDPKSSHDDGFKPSIDDGKKVNEDLSKRSECNDQEKEDNVNNTNNVNAVGTNKVNAVGELPFDPDMPALEDVDTFDFSNKDEDDDAVADMNNLDTTIQVSPTPTTRIHKDHPLDQVIRDFHSTTQTRYMTKNLEKHGFEELLQFKLQEVWILVDLPNKKRAIGTKWVFKNKKDERGIIIRNKPRLIAQGHIQEERINYDEVFAPVARIEATRLFLAYASFKDFMVYQMDVKSAFLYEKIEEEVYVCHLPGFEDPDFPDRVYKVEKALYGLHQAPRACQLKVNAARHNLLLPVFWFTAMAKTIYEEAQIHAWVDGKEIITTESSVRRDLRLTDEEGVDCLPNSTIFENLELMGKPKRKNSHVPQLSGSTKNVADEAVYKKLDDKLVRAATTASSLEAEQDSGNIDKTQSKATPNEASSSGTTSGGGPKCQESIGDTIAQTRVLDLEKTKTTQALEITSLKRRVKKLEKKQRSRTYKLKRLYKVGLTARVDSFKDTQSLDKDASKKGRKINDIDVDKDITLVNDQDDAEMFDVNDLHGEEVFIEKEVADKEVSVAGEVNAASIATTVSAAATITTEVITLAQALVEIKTSKPKAKWTVLQEPSESTTTTKTISSKKSQDNGKGIMVEEPVKLKKKDQIRLDEEAALKLQAELQEEFDEEQRLARERERELKKN